jgi:predicted  nucleic acid-binding Zn-ribbon protein
MNIIDSRELAEELKDLRLEKEILEEQISDLNEEIYNLRNKIDEKLKESDVEGMSEINKEIEKLKSDKKDLENELEDWVEDNQEKLDDLETLEDEVPEWEYGATLIHEDSFEEYCEEELNDLGIIDSKQAWFVVIDWEATADNMRQDYMEVTYEGDTYLCRA